jgi:23S rRNA (pseudouridine1915-N3)-methyltransferase
VKITLLCIGKTDEPYLNEGIEKYLKRLKFYVDFKFIVIPDIKKNKGMSFELQKKKEGEIILKNLISTDQFILLDEQGKEYSSMQFSTFLEKKMVASVQNLVFIIGGPYGFDDAVYQRANGKLSLSKMTFSHQMIRLFFVEQLYRAYTIIKKEPYHHE